MTRGRVLWRPSDAGPAAVGSLLLVAVGAWVDALLGGASVGGLPVLAAVVILAFLAGRRGSHPAVVVAVPASVILLAISDQISDAGRFSLASDGVFYAVVVVGPALLGMLAAARAAQLAELMVRTEELQGRLATTELVARAEESARVEREVDRTLASRLTAIVDGTRRAARLEIDDRVRAPALLAEIEQTARDALGELRGVLGILDHESPVPVRITTAGVRPPGRAPNPGPGPVDAILVLTSLPLAVETALAGPGGTGRALDVGASVLQGLALLLVRRRPVAGGVVLLAVACAQSLLLTPVATTVSWLLTGLVLAFLLGHRPGRRDAAVGLVAIPLVVVALYLATPSGRTTSGLIPTTVAAALTWWAGRTLAVREQRAARLADVCGRLASTRDDRSRLAAREQRVELARELHDVGAHALTVVCLQAAAAQTWWVRDPARSRTAMMALGHVAEGSLTHVRDSLGSLGDDSAATRLDPAGLDVLADLGRALGLVVDVAVVGIPRPMSGEVARVAFRVVQESLTNAARYATHAQVRIGIGYDDHGVDVRVIDSGPDPTGTAAVGVNGAGLGQRGMRARVEALSGHLSCGPCAGGGYAVHARLPLTVAS